MKAAWIAHWTGIVPGREREVIELTRELDEHHNKLLEEGKIDDWARFIGSGERDYFILRGDEAALRELMTTPEAVSLLIKSDLVLTDFQSDTYMTGEGAQAVLDVYEQTAKEMHLV